MVVEHAHGLRQRRGFTVVEWGGAELRTGAEAASAE